MSIMTFDRAFNKSKSPVESLMLLLQHFFCIIADFRTVRFILDMLHCKVELTFHLKRPKYSELFKATRTVDESIVHVCTVCHKKVIYHYCANRVNLRLNWRFNIVDIASDVN